MSLKGPRPARNMLLLPSMADHASIERGFCSMHLGTQFLLIAAHTALWFSKRPHYSFFWPILLATDVVVLMRYTVIAIKYGYMTRSERRRVR